MVSSALIAPDTSVAAAARSQHSHPGLTWPCPSACIWGGRFPVNPTPERLLHGAEAGSALSRLRQSCPRSPARFSPSTDTSPWLRGISGLPHYQDHRQGQTQQLGNTVRAVWDTSPHGWAAKGRGHKRDRCFSPAEGPPVCKRLTKHSTLRGKGTGVQPKIQGLERKT